MKLPHLALTVIEDPDHDGRFHWLLLRGTGNADTVEDFEASEHSYGTALEAFEAGSARWKSALSVEDEDADPVGDPEVD
jgi:hypothetical protein